MLIKVEQKFVRTAPRKLRLIADSIRNLPLASALEQLQAINKQATLSLKKTLRQAQANAVHNHQLDPEHLTIKELQISQGPTYKRWQPVSRGRAHSIFKHTSHIRITLEAPDDTIKPSRKTPNPAKPKTPIIKSINKKKK